MNQRLLNFAAASSEFCRQPDRPASPHLLAAPSDRYDSYDSVLTNPMPSQQLA
jgi:hypothetical protein